ncbi:hypothetical protein JXA85_06410 [Candidatus Woesearchaeota archaeon]|nr:hypothetical protein [Candidatus Woesearchaeota archaeon]
MKTIIKEYIMKNIVLLALLLFSYFTIGSYLSSINLASDKTLSGSVLVAMSIIAVIACFGNFAFTYEKINIKIPFHRYLAHFTTGLLTLVIGVSLIFTSILLSFIIGRFILLDVLFILLYAACVGYDLWDIMRIEPA